MLSKWMVIVSIIVVLMGVIFVQESSCYPTDRSNDGFVKDDDNSNRNYLVGVKYDEYPMIVPKKRAALLIDRLMVALQKAIDEEEEEAAKELLKNNNVLMKPEDAVRGMDLQRRGRHTLPGHQKGRVYWRCYFNAVTCF